VESYRILPPNCAFRKVLQLVVMLNAAVMQLSDTGVGLGNNEKRGFSGRGTLRLGKFEFKEIPIHRCQGNARSRWLAKRRTELLPVSYFHIVFTLPHELSALALQKSDCFTMCCSELVPFSELLTDSPELPFDTCSEAGFRTACSCQTRDSYLTFR
jgi:transposase-like zinc-binding protein